VARMDEENEQEGRDGGGGRAERSHVCGLWPSTSRWRTVGSDRADGLEGDQLNVFCIACCCYDEY
jgi:hypothetical protein